MILMLYDIEYDVLYLKKKGVQRNSKKRKENEYKSAIEKPVNLDCYCMIITMIEASGKLFMY